MPKQARINGIKLYRCYTPKEAATLVGVSHRTIRNWTKDGLRLLDAQYPPLIRGDDLREYILVQRQNRKVQTGICEFYCLRCRKRRPPSGGYGRCGNFGQQSHDDGQLRCL